jgi:hypothetical protein
MDIPLVQKRKCPIVGNSTEKCPGCGRNMGHMLKTTPVKHHSYDHPINESNKTCLMGASS